MTELNEIRLKLYVRREINVGPSKYIQKRNNYYNYKMTSRCNR